MRQIVPINFDWKYTKNFKKEYIKSDFNDKDFENVNIPHTNIEFDYNNIDEKAFQFISCYRKNLFIQELKADERVNLCFGAVMAYAEVFINEKKVTSHKGGYTPFKVDITEYINTNQDNTLVVMVDSNERKDIPPFGHVIDYLTYGGIYREVHLEYTHSVYLQDIMIKPADVLTQNPKMHIQYDIINPANTDKDCRLNFSLLYDNKEVDGFDETIHISGTQKTYIKKCTTTDIKLWDTKNPNLYHLKSSLYIDDILVDEKIERFGFRQIDFDNTGFYLNGEKLKIRGLNRHQSFPYVGYAMPKSAQYKDAEILKYELGVNTVRLSHYPQSNHFMNRCDELGLLVFDEIPGWQHIGSDDWKEVAKANVAEMIKKDFNHPSVFLWGTRINESKDDHDFYASTSKIAREMDDSRVVGGVRCIKNSELLEDVYTYNDFSHIGTNKGLDHPNKVTKTKKGYLVTEHNGHMYPTKKFDDETHRMSQCKRHMSVLQSCYETDEIGGAIGWCMFDYNTHKDFGSGDKICYHGVMDMFRIPKPAAAVYSSQQNETPVLSISNSMSIGEYPASQLPDIYAFTNCDEIKLYLNGKLINSFYPDKKLYKDVPNPPIIIDDIVGNQIEENEDFSKKDAATLKQMMLTISKGKQLSLLLKLKLLRMLIKYNMNMADGEALYTEYIGGWGSESKNYRFDGIKNGKVVKSVEKAKLFNPQLHVEVDNTTLTECETYDTTRFVVSLKDEFGNDIIYANDAFLIETSENIQLIGPKTVSLIGGSIGFWVKTCGKQGDATVKIISSRFGTIEKQLNIIKK